MLRISGPRSAQALLALCGQLPNPRVARLATIRDPANGVELDRALTLWFPGPASATGEDIAEIHAHGGRAVVRCIEAALAALPGLRRAEPGEFTRRALLNGRIGLGEAEGLADLLSAETEGQRRAAFIMAGGALSRLVTQWQEHLLMLSARIEALLDFADEEDVERDNDEIGHIINHIADLATAWRRWLSSPPAERLRDGLTVAIAGPPNAGKSTLLNALASREAAIVSPVAGTTRDIIEVPLALDGLPFRFADTAGLHDGTGDVIEAQGMARARAWVGAADMLLWLGGSDDAPDHPCRCRISAQCDHRPVDAGADIALSAQTGEGMVDLHRWLVDHARDLLPAEGEVAMNARHRAALAEALAAIDRVGEIGDPILLGESLRTARIAIDHITGQAGTEAMLDALFGRFCIGK